MAAVVAEDDEGLNRLICKHLERRGLKLIGVHSGADAIAAIQQHPDCLLLLDYVLLDMDGHQLLGKLDDMGLRVPFIVMTGRGDERVAVEMMKLGARDYLVKQPDFLELVPPVVERVLGQLETERKLGRAESAVRHSEERHRLLFETMGQGVLYQDADGRIVSANPAAERILGLTLDQLQGRTSGDPRWRAIHEDGSDFPGETHASMVALRTGEEINGVIMGLFNPTAASYRWISIDAVPQFRPGELKPYQVYATFTDITELKQAEQALRAEKERAQKYLDIAGVMLVALDAEGRITLMNRCGYEILGYQEGELIGRNWFDVCVAGRARDQVRGVFSWLTAGAAKSVEYYENPIVTRSGEERLIAWYNVILRDESGRATGILSSGEDITARRQAEQQAQAERDQLRRILDAVPDGAYVVGQDYEIQYVNPALLARSGPVKGRKCHEYFHGRNEPCPDCANPQVFAGTALGREYTTEQGVTYEVQDVPVTGNDGRPARLGFQRDITARKNAELREKQHLDDTTLLRDTALGFITLDPDADIYRYIAQRLSQLAGEAYIVVNSYDATRDEFCVRAIEGVGEHAEAATKVLVHPPVGMTFKLAPEELRDYSGSILMKLEGGLPALSLGKLPKVAIAAVESVFRPGGIYAMSFYWQGKILGTVNIIMRKGETVRDPAVVEAFVNQAAIALRRKLDADELERHRQHLEELVTERTSALTVAQEQLVQHGKLMTLGRVAGSVAHEIRNPLGAIKNASWFLQKNVADKLEGKPLRHLRLIDENIETANRAITSILDFTWRLQGEPKKCALRPMLERAVAEATIPAAVSVHLDVKPGLPHVLVDDRQMVAVFRNLFSNAVQAMAGVGTLRVAARRAHSMIAVDVIDTGSGIKPEHLARVFEPLFTTKDVGIGLGLAICKDFVEANRGTISVKSEANKGTTFTVVLPTAEQDKPETPDPKLQEERAASEDKL